MPEGMKGFQPGNTVGAAGRPKGSKNRIVTSDALRKEAEEAFEEGDVKKVWKKLIEAAIAGKAWALEMLMNRMYGKPVNTEMHGEVGGMKLEDVIAMLRGGKGEEPEAAAVALIKTEDQYNDALARVDALMGAGADEPEGDELELLVVSIQLYEKRAHPIEPPSGDESAGEPAGDVDSAKTEADDA